MSPEEQAPVHGFTLDWWSRLPLAWRAADRGQAPESGGVPLLRFMDGIGRVAGQTRDLNESMWDGTLLDPDHTPDHLLPWLAWLLGMPGHRRNTRPDTLRNRIRALSATGSHGLGTRSHITEAVLEFLEPGARVQILSSDTHQHTLVIGVAEEDVPDGDYQTLEQKIRAANITPAGHALIVQDLRTTWDAWEATAGETWDDKEENIPTWADSDSAGVTFEDP